MFKMQLKLVNGSVCDQILTCHEKKKNLRFMPGITYEAKEMYT